LKDYQAELVRVLGPTLGGRALVAALGYPTVEAFQKARERGRVPVPTFAVPGRRGRFAATTDVAAWLWRQRRGSGDPDA
jgi:hypothetical protein